MCPFGLLETGRWRGPGHPASIDKTWPSHPVTKTSLPAVSCRAKREAGLTLARDCVSPKGDVPEDGREPEQGVALTLPRHCVSWAVPLQAPNRAAHVMVLHG